MNLPGSKSKGEDVQVTWDNPEELENYIKKLQKAADRLTTENRKLRKSHNTVCEKVGEVTNIYYRIRHSLLFV
jgi:dynein heavy chain 2